MQVEFDRDTCTGMFQCIHEWEAFSKDMDAGKAVLADAEEVEPDRFVRDVPSDAEFDAKMAARVCPVEAIRILSDDGDQIVP